MDSTIETAQDVVSTAIAWVARRHNEMGMDKCRADDIPLGLWDQAHNTRNALDVAALAGDIAAAKVAAREYCLAWQALFEAEKQNRSVKNAV